MYFSIFTARCGQNAQPKKPEYEYPTRSNAEDVYTLGFNGVLMGSGGKPVITAGMSQLKKKCPRISASPYQAVLFHRPNMSRVVVKRTLYHYHDNALALVVDTLVRR